MFIELHSSVDPFLNAVFAIIVALWFGNVYLIWKKLSECINRDFKLHWPNMKSPDCKCNPHDQTWMNNARSLVFNNECSNQYCVRIVLLKIAHHICHASGPIYLDMYNLKNSLLVQCISQAARFNPRCEIFLILDRSVVLEGKKNRQRIEQLREAGKQLNLRDFSD